MNANSSEYGIPYSKVEYYQHNIMRVPEPSEAFRKRNMATVKRIAFYAGGTILLLFAFNCLILFASLMQVVTEERTGYWSPYWRWQAEAVISVVKLVAPSE